MIEIVDNICGEIEKSQRTMFDGDVDSELVEYLNLKLDDN
ncbi:unnamed protein product [Angiostrongylus costaricensis]|uniref:Uncharacterized protein n=1 Tax=Angiostrongylus costaricensis TaxID=334426 RepID=A0A0R3PFV9_ANGCS|nr:unnamed protein product [Angiostrongylus costaricensis]